MDRMGLVSKVVKQHNLDRRFGRSPAAWTILIVGTVFLLAACSGSGPADTDEATTTSTLVPNPTVELTTAPTATQMPPPTIEPTATPSPTPPPAPTRKSIPEIIKALTPSVVHIQTEAVRLDSFNRPVPVGGVGTGEILDQRGHILTNNHVVAGAERIIITLSDGRAFEAKLVGGDPALDLAVLLIDADNLVPIPVGESSKLQVGDQVIAIGHALDLPGGPTVTSGLVSALERSIGFSQTITMQHLIQTDAAINPGNSGGPLVNIDGEFVGINSAGIPSGEGIGFAIAVDPVMSLIEELIAKGKIERGFLGISGVNINEALASNFNLPVNSGVGVAMVAPGSPAEQVGIKERDIVVGVAGKEVRNLSELDGILIEYRVGSSVPIDFYRDDKKQTVTAVLGERPS